MKNTKLFGDLTPRMEHFRNEVLDTEATIGAERALLATEAYKANEAQVPYIKRARMLENVLDHMSIYIEDDTLIVGNQAEANRCAPVFPEYTMEFIINELETFEKRDGDVFRLTDDTIEKL